jgi:16S rRNA (guanine966-N2)-methyltransferase
MSIHILGGMAKGFTLATPPDSITRPTSVLLRRKLFDYYQDLSESIFIDLCAGSGAMGLEAASRGAWLVEFIELNPKAYKVAETNIKLFQNKFKNQQLKLIKFDAIKWLSTALSLVMQSAQENEMSVILFFDPPYEEISLYEKFFEQVKSQQFRGIVIVEACRQKTMVQDEFEERFGKADKIYKQGTSFLYLYDYNND